MKWDGVGQNGTESEEIELISVNITQPNSIKLIGFDRMDVTILCATTRDVVMA